MKVNSSIDSVVKVTSSNKLNFHEKLDKFVEADKNAFPR